MTPGDDEARIRAALAEAHRDERTPSFDSVWSGVARVTVQPVAGSRSPPASRLRRQWACGWWRVLLRRADGIRREHDGSARPIFSSRLQIS